MQPAATNRCLRVELSRGQVCCPWCFSTRKGSRPLPSLCAVQRGDGGAQRPGSHGLLERGWSPKDVDQNPPWACSPARQQNIGYRTFLLLLASEYGSYCAQGHCISSPPMPAKSMGLVQFNTVTCFDTLVLSTAGKELFSTYVTGMLLHNCLCIAARIQQPVLPALCLCDGRPACIANPTCRQQGM